MNLEMETITSLAQRMVQSTALLDLALETIEQWSQIKSARYGETRIGYRHGYLRQYII